MAGARTVALIEVQQLQLPGRLQPLDFQLQPGELLGLIGPNGAGKSSLLHCLAGIEPGQGEIRLQGRELQQWSPQTRAQQIGLLPQRCQSAWALKVADIIALGRLPWGDEDADAIARAAQLAGVEQWLQRPVARLSGGEQARVWLARVLAGEPQLLLADEPLASLDLYYQCRVLECLRAYASGERAVILSLHDLSLAARSCDRLCLLDQGRVHALGTPAQVLTVENLRAVYGIEAQIDLQAEPPLVVALG